MTGVDAAWGRLRPWAPSRWKLWSLGGRTAAYLLTWDLAAVLLVARSATTQRLVGHEVVDLVTLAVLAVGYDEVSRRLENQRLGLARGPHVSMRSVWSFVGAALLPLTLFAVLAAVIYTHAAAVGARDNARVAPNRALFNTATMVLSGAAVAWVTSGASGLLVTDTTVERIVDVSVGVVAYFVVNLLAVAGAFASLNGRITRADLGTRNDNLLAVATLGLGAAAVLIGSPWAVLTAVPAMYLLQRSALLEELETAATQDGKTGLLNSAAWHVAAEQELRRSHDLGRSVAVLVVDLDLFKQVNDRHGHLAGDAVLAAAAECLTHTLRDADLIGRFGGEEFVAVLPGLDVADALTAAERVRTAIAARTPLVSTGDGVVAVGVTASVGVATAPAHGRTVTDLLAAADQAMYEAKRTGRNRVVAARPPDGADPA